jgi:pimeloyl-ACP methyl ester carboxylesterase
MSQRMVTANGIELWTEAFGDPADPPILLIMGATAQAIWWPEEMCARLAAAGHFVIRFDNRDVGQSGTVDFAAAPYTVIDLAEDAAGILDAYEITSAHVVGAALGGQVGCFMTLSHPGRVRTLTLIWTSLAIHEVARALTGARVDADLPLPGPDTISRVRTILANPPTTREERVALRAEIYISSAGSRFPADSAEVYDLMNNEYDRARDWDASHNHIFVSAATPPASEMRRRLADIDVPTLIIHGTEDRDLTIEHGRALAAAIPGAVILEIDGLGHQFHRNADAIMADAIIAHAKPK